MDVKNMKKVIKSYQGQGTTQGGTTTQGTQGGTTTQGQETTQFKESDVVFTDDIIKYLINSYTKESGVRNLNRCLETIMSRLNVIRMLGDSVDKFKFSFLVKVTFPLTVTKDIIGKLLKKEEERDESYKRMYM